MENLHLEAELKAGNTEQKIFQISFFLMGIGMTIIAGMMINSLYFLLNLSIFNSYNFHLFIVDACLGFIIYIFYKLKKFLNSSEFLMFRQYKSLKKYINEKYSS
jgi:hypothetical protein